MNLTPAALNLTEGAPGAAVAVVLGSKPVRRRGAAQRSAAAGPYSADRAAAAVVQPAIGAQCAKVSLRTPPAASEAALQQPP